MSNYYYSAKRNGFYLFASKEQYEASTDGWPDDAVAITDDEHASLMKGQTQGKIITAGSDGKPVLSAPVIDWQLNAEQQRQSLITSANSTIADWRDELHLDVISDEDKASLIKWMAYIKALKALDLSGVSDEAAYTSIEWPEKPES